MSDTLANVLQISPLSSEKLLEIDAFIKNVKFNPELFSENQTGSNNNHYGCKHTDETKRIISEKAKNRPKIYGRKLSDETKRKISASKTGIKSNRDYSNPWNKGKKHSPQTIEKMRLAKLGKKKNVTPSER